jgi:hypothetical protein
VDGLVEGQANRHVQLYDTKGYRYRITGRAFYRRRGSEQAPLCRMLLDDRAETNSLLRDVTAATSPPHVLKISTYTRRGQMS